MEWGHAVIGALRDSREIASKIELNTLPTSTARHYWKTTLTAFEYQRGDVPADEQLRRDLGHMLGHLALLYARAESDPLMPGVGSPEITLAVESIDEAQGRPAARYRGQGFRLSKPEQRAVERRAVDLATEHFQSLGWKVRDVGATSSFDLHCTRDLETLYVEVKGTTSAGKKILLTRNEVALHREMHPNNALAVVSEIALNRYKAQPTASGGELRVLSPWLLDPELLSPIAYEYVTVSNAALP